MQSSQTGRAIASVAVLVLMAGIAFRFFRTDTREANPAPAVNLSTQDSTSARRNFDARSVPAAEADVLDETDDNKDGPPKLPREKVEEYLARNNRSAASLLAAFHALDDTNYLNEAAGNFPGEPQVQWTILARDAFPEERRKWLDSFKASSPDNSLANYLSAADYFKGGQRDLAFQELLDASHKTQFHNYAMEAKLNEEELSRAAGRTPLESIHVGGWAADLLPELATLKGLARAVGDSSKQYLDTGDSGSANNLVQLELGLADRLTSGEGGRFVIDRLVGMAIEAISLKQLNQDKTYHFLGGKTPAERLAEMKQEKESFKELSKSFSDAYGNMTEAEMMGFSDRFKTYGEIEALRWVQQRFGTNLQNR